MCRHDVFRTLLVATLEGASRRRFEGTLLPWTYPMRRLPDVIKRRIVEHLACYYSHAEVTKLIVEEFDVELTPRHIRAYDPTSFQFAGAHRWLEYFQTVRRRCAQEVGGIAIAHRAYRMRQLQGIFDRAIDRGDCWQALQTLEQAAKEMGNWFVRS